MERKLQERMVGAGVLVLALIVLGPLILDGRQRDAGDEEVPGQHDDELRRHTFRMTPPASPAANSERTSLPVPVAGSPAVSPAGLAGAGQPESEAAAARNGLPATPAAVAPAVPAPMARTDPAPAREAPVAASAAVAEKPAARPAPVSKPPQPAATPAQGSGLWLVQVGTFGQKGNAERLAAGLKAKGFAAFVSPTQRAGKGVMYRVRVGPAGTREAATGLAGRLSASGQSGQVVAQ